MSSSRFDVEGTLNYHIPSDLPGKIRTLCELMRLPYDQFAQLPEEQAVELLAGVILFHHLPKNSPEKGRVWQMVYAAPGPLIPLLSNKILDPKINPQWGIWAMNTEDLFGLLDSTAGVSEFGSAIGMSASLPGAAALFKAAKSEGPPNRKGLARVAVVATILAWGFFEQNAASNRSAQEELFRRGARR